jgi:hypothetical protein
MVQTDTTEATTVADGLRQAAVSDDELRQTLGESFTIFNATISMCSLFLGFIYFALLALLAGDNDFSTAERWACRCLVLGFLAMLGALMGFHVTAHQVYRYWRLFFPTSRIQRLARTRVRQSQAESGHTPTVQAAPAASSRSARTRPGRFCLDTRVARLSLTQ